MRAIEFRQRNQGLFLVLVFLSGFCALTYQVVWERTLKYCYGGDDISSAVIVSVFMLGLGLGGFLFRKAGRNAMRTLAVVELAIGLFGLRSYEMILGLNRVVRALLRGPGQTAGPGYGAVLLGAGTCLIVPTVFMGATLPLMIESFVPKIAKNTKFIGRVYGLNTIGAFVGALIPPLVLGTWGLPVTLRASSCLSLFVGFVLLVFPRRPSEGESSGARSSVAGHSFWTAWDLRLLGFAFVSGFVALAFEILFFRIYGIVQGFSAYTFPVVVSAYLLSMGLGSIVWTSLRDRLSRAWAWRLPFLLQAGMAAVVPIGLVFLELILKKTNPAYLNFVRMFDLLGVLLDSGRVLSAVGLLFIYAAPILVLVVPIIFIGGGVFPLLIKNLSEGTLTLGRSVGTIYLANSFGCAAGALTAGFVAIPVIGWNGAVVLTAAAAILVGMAGIAGRAFSGRGSPGFGPRAGPSKRAVARFAVLIAAPLVLYAVSDRHLNLKIATGRYAGNAPIVAYREGVTGIAAAVRPKRTTGLAKEHRDPAVDIYSDGFRMSSIPSPRSTYIANTPRLQDELGSVLILGLGGGRNAADLLADPRVRRIVAVDWSREIIGLVSSPPVSLYNGDPFRDARLTVLFGDAKQVVRDLAQAGEKFDAVIDNLCFPSWAGAGGVKSVEHFRDIHRILSPQGFYYHIPNAENDRDWQLILDTLAAVFDHVTILNERFMICGRDFFAPSEARVREVLTPAMVSSTAPFFVSKSTPASEIYQTFMDQIVPVDKASLQSGLLTDAVPATEFPISFSDLWRLAARAIKHSRIGGGRPSDP
jgi:spermidine synthase